MATTENTTSDLTSRPIPVSIENDILDVSCAARTLYCLLEGVVGKSGTQSVHEEDANALFWCAGMLLSAANQLKDKYHGAAEKEVTHG
jgi:hypothetical protein